MIGIIVPANLKYSPFVSYYVKKMEDDGIPYEIISWNRRELEESCDHVFQYSVTDRDRHRVLSGYFKFASFAGRIIRRRKYSGLIVFTVGAAFFMLPILCGKYRKRFIFDIRDDSPIVKRLPGQFKKICGAAHSIGVSSPEFLSWISGEAVMSHNADMDVIAAHIDDIIEQPKEQVKNIVFAGMLIEGEINLELVKLFQNDPVFGFGFVGTECSAKKAIQSYVEQNQVKNVFFQGPYNKAEITDIYREKASYVNVIRKKSKINEQAVPNKLYDAVIAGRPVIVLRHNKAVVQYVTEYGLGVVLDNLDADEIRQKMAEFDQTQIATGAYAENRKRFLARVQQDNVDFEKMVKTFAADCGETYG